VQIVKTINGINYSYTTFFQIKKNGKRREINAPCELLKNQQRHLKNLLSEKMEQELPTYIVGFRSNYNLKKNGELHLGKKWVINLDIKDFFPSIKKELLEQELGSYEQLLNTRGYTFDQFIEFVTLHKALPQGSPISPLLSNYIGYKIVDKEVYPYLQNKYGDKFAYSRYADDITISFDALNTRDELKDEVENVIKIVESSGFFKINKKKTSIMHNSQKQVVTGVVVNMKTSLGKKEKLKYRAIVHKIKNKQIEMTDVLQGKLAYLNSVDPDYYNKLKRSLE
jgi:RNA-directed DNA polymerase